VGWRRALDQLKAETELTLRNDAHGTALIPATGGASTRSIAPASISTLYRKAVMKMASNSRWNGYAGTINTETLAKRAAEPGDYHDSHNFPGK
jgi:hypothetical protein